MNNESAELATVAQAAEPLAVMPEPTLMPQDILVIAEKPDELQAAQGQMVAWAEAKVADLNRAYDEATAALEAAKTRRLELAPYRAMMRGIQADLHYYTKMWDALAAGYCIVPNMPIQLIAVRLDEDATPSGRGLGQSATWTKRPGVGEATSEMLPSGEGKMVDPRPTHYVSENRIKRSDGSTEIVYESKPTQFVDPRFPIVMRKPRVLEATERAMALKCFDQVGVLPATRRQDPLVLGQIKRKNGKLVSFLIAWWIDTRDL